MAIDDQIGAPAAWQFNDPAALTARRQYVTAVVRQRVHQRGFRRRVLRAYQQCCAICRLRHDELLEALTSSPTAIPWGSRSFPTASRSASSTTLPSTATSSASRPTSRSPCASTCWRIRRAKARTSARADHLKPNRDFLAERYALSRRAS